jgi:GNAT superfamily N-acetyltransferase
MTATIEPIRLRDEQVMSASHILARAFYDGPMTVYVEPDEARRERILPGFYSTGVLLGHRLGEVYTTAGSLHAAAVWMPPDAPEMTPEHVEQAGSADRHAEMGEAAMERFNQVMAVWGALHARDMAMPYWYLMILGVDPPIQRQGIGGQMIAPVLARADAAGIPCYLETEKERNVAFYRAYGFDMLVEDTMPNAFRYWTTRRSPRG